MPTGIVVSVLALTEIDPAAESLKSSARAGAAAIATNGKHNTKLVQRLTINIAVNIAVLSLPTRHALVARTRILAVEHPRVNARLRVLG